MYVFLCAVCLYCNLLIAIYYLWRKSAVFFLFSHLHCLKMFLPFITCFSQIYGSNINRTCLKTSFLRLIATATFSPHKKRSGIQPLFVMSKSDIYSLFFFLVSMLRSSAGFVLFILIVLHSTFRLSTEKIHN